MVIYVRTRYVFTIYQCFTYAQIFARCSDMEPKEWQLLEYCDAVFRCKHPILVRRNYKPRIMKVTIPQCFGKICTLSLAGGLARGSICALLSQTAGDMVYKQTGETGTRHR